MIVYRVLPWDATAHPRDRGGPLWFPRELQGDGRHDNPDRYGCLYLAEDPLAAIAEQLAPFRGTGDLRPSMLRRAGAPLALATIELADQVRLVDLDEPLVLKANGLRPSLVATGQRTITQAHALRLFDAHRSAGGVRWWSTLESSWINATVFDRAAEHLSVTDVVELAADQRTVVSAARFVGLA